MVASSKKKAVVTDPEVLEGSTSRIRTVVDKIEPSGDDVTIIGLVSAVHDGIKKKDRRELMDAALTKYFRSEILKPYQAELIKLQQHLERTDKKVIILFDGRDASGKGGTIRRVVRYMNEKRYRVIALGKPTVQQRTELHMKRYIEHFPHAGEFVLFDRSWYNRALVEPVMGFCTTAQYKRFMDKVVGYEDRIIADQKTLLIKLYFSVSKGEQERRFEKRKNDPLRQWKLSEVDLQAQDLWDEFTQMKYRLLKKTHTPETPWFVIRSDDKASRPARDHQADPESDQVLRDEAGPSIFHRTRISSSRATGNSRSCRSRNGNPASSSDDRQWNRILTAARRP